MTKEIVKRLLLLFHTARNLMIFVTDTTRVLFAAVERLVPRIRIESRQVERLMGHRVIVCIDGWPRDSRYPIGHYVRTIGAIGDRETENEVCHFSRTAHLFKELLICSFDSIIVHKGVMFFCGASGDCVLSTDKSAKKFC